MINRRLLSLLIGLAAGLLFGLLTTEPTALPWAW